MFTRIAKKIPIIFADILNLFAAIIHNSLG